ncbi:MAG: DMT family transporter [Polyangiales bacterium]
MSRPSARPLGIGHAIGAAVLFGVSTPLSKVLLRDLSPWMLAGSLYLGAGVGLLAVRALSPASHEPLPSRRELPWIAVAVLAGGAVAPVLLMEGLRRTPATTSSLLLNLEGALTAAIAWGVFREHVDRRLALGMALIVAASALLSWSGGPMQGAGSLLGPLLIAGACLGWAIDNNSTRRVSQLDPRILVIAKGLVAGSVNLGLALSLGQRLPAALPLLGALALGFVSYGLSLMLFVLALRNLGTARTGAYFALAPFAGALASIAVLGEHPAWTFYVASAAMALGLGLHLSERHAHLHRHPPVEHEHAHAHDEHHRHDHPSGVHAVDGHSHMHRHDSLEHDHPHYPDTHHRHPHDAA